MARKKAVRKKAARKTTRSKTGFKVRTVTLSMMEASYKESYDIGDVQRGTSRKCEWLRDGNCIIIRGTCGEHYLLASTAEEREAIVKLLS